VDDAAEAAGYGTMGNATMRLKPRAYNGAKSACADINGNNTRPLGRHPEGDHTTPAACANRRSPKDLSPESERQSG